MEPLRTNQRPFFTDPLDNKVFLQFCKKVYDYAIDQIYSFPEGEDIVIDQESLIRFIDAEKLPSLMKVKLAYDIQNIIGSFAEARLLGAPKHDVIKRIISAMDGLRDKYQIPPK